MALTFLDAFNDLIKSASPYAIYEVEKTGKKNIVLAFDSIQEISVKAGANITSYPTENNIEATDYKFNTPTSISIRGLIQRQSLSSQIVSSLASKIGVGEDLLSKTKSQLDLYLAGIYNLNIQTKSGLYENYSLIGYEIPENYDNYGYMEVVMDFQQNLFPLGSNPLSLNVSDVATVFSGLLSKVESNILGIF